MKYKESLAFVIEIFFIALVFSSSTLHAQTKAENLPLMNEESFIARRYFSISALPLIVAAKASIKGDTKKYSLSSAPQLSFEALVNYHYDFEKNYSLIFGLGGGVIGHNFDYVIPKEMFNPPTGSDITSNTAVSREKDLFYFKVPVELERRWGSVPGRQWNTNIGTSLLFSPDRIVEGFDAVFLYDGSTHKYLIKTQDSNNNGKPWLNYHMSVGHSWPLPKKNSLRANLKLNLSFTEFAKVNYYFDLPPEPILSGQYGVTGSYLGLAISYIFSGRNSLQ